MLSFGTCNGNRGGFTVNNLGILVVVFVPKRTRLELPFICFGGHFRKKMYCICMCFQYYYYAMRRKNVSSVAVLTRDLELPRSNRNECELLFKWKEVKRILKENIFSQGSVFLHFLSSFIIIRIAVSFFVKKYRMIWLAQLPTVYCSLLIFWIFRYALEDF